MRILVGMGHPKHVYMFKNCIEEIEKRGHEVKILAIEKDITEYLLRKFNMPYILIGKNPPSIYKKMLSVPKWEYLTLKIAKEFKPDIYIGQTLPHFAHTSAILRKAYITFEDTESATTVQKVCFPFTDAIVTPSCYKADLGEKQVRFEGYYELAYLHPNYFTPNPAVLDEMGVSKDDTFVILRFVSWTASHDIGQSGFNFKKEKDLMGFLRSLEENNCRVFISSEKELPQALELYKIKVSPEKMHDILYFAEMYIGEGATMAAEAAVLGTPSIYVSSIQLGNIDELRDRYGLVYTCLGHENALKIAKELLSTPKLKEEWQKKREKLLKDKIDVTSFMIWFVENYHESFSRYKKGA